MNQRVAVSLLLRVYELHSSLPSAIIWASARGCWEAKARIFKPWCPVGIETYISGPVKAALFSEAWNTNNRCPRQASENQASCLGAYTCISAPKYLTQLWKIGPNCLKISALWFEPLLMDVVPHSLIPPSIPEAASPVQCSSLPSNHS